MADYDWDPAKSASNLVKHGLTFDEAITIFEGPVLTGEDPFDDEVRERSYGLLNGTIVICVIHTERGDVTRIISARKATKKETELFHDYLRKASH